MEYSIVVKGIKQRVLPALDDEFARDLGEFDSLTALQERVEQDLRRQATHESERQLRRELLKELASRLTFAEPPSLVEREMERRVYLDLHVKVKTEWRDNERLLDDIDKQNRVTE